MPGTREVQGIVKADTKHVPPRPSVLDRIVRSLSVKSKQPMPGYAIPGTASRGVFWASKALRDRDSFGQIPATEDVNLAFFSRESSYSTQLLSVRREGFDIHIEYRFEPLYSPEPQVNFALIPLGQLPAGKYHVKVHKSSMEQKHLQAGFKTVSDEQASRLVSSPFSFEIVPAPELSKDAVVTPLNQIWALDMPGTMPMNEDQKLGKHISEEGPLLKEIRWHFHMLRRRPESKIPEAGFVVNGMRMEAMRKAHAVLAKNEQIQNSFAEGEELSLVFYNYPSTWYVYVHDVVRQGNEIRIRYKFVPHESTKVTNHFALIPLKNLTEGEYQVTIEQLPLEQRYVEEGWKPQPPRPDRLVCESFKFSIRNEINN